MVYETTSPRFRVQLWDTDRFGHRWRTIGGFDDKEKAIAMADEHSRYGEVLRVVEVPGE